MVGGSSKNQTFVGTRPYLPYLIFGIMRQHGARRRHRHTPGQKSIPQKSWWISVALSNICAVVFSNIQIICQLYFRRIVTFPADFRWNCPMDFQWHVQMKFHFCDFWCGSCYCCNVVVCYCYGVCCMFMLLVVSVFIFCPDRPTIGSSQRGFCKGGFSNLCVSLCNCNISGSVVDVQIENIANCQTPFTNPHLCELPTLVMCY